MVHSLTGAHAQVLEKCKIIEPNYMLSGKLRASLSGTYVGNKCLEFANHAVTVTNRWVQRCSFRVHSTVLCSHPSRACAVSGYQLHTALRQAPRLHKGVVVGEGGGWMGGGGGGANLVTLVSQRGSYDSIIWCP